VVEHQRDGDQDSRYHASMSAVRPGCLGLGLTLFPAGSYGAGPLTLCKPGV
jgi:hypothetical protein